MKLMLHSPNSEGELSSLYKRAFGNAIELFIVTAFLTEWDDSLELNSDCRSFRLIIGKDFGITKKAACEKVMEWLVVSQFEFPQWVEPGPVAGVVGIWLA